MKSTNDQRLRLALIHVLTPISFGGCVIYFWIYYRKRDYEAAHAALITTLWFVSFSILACIYACFMIFAIIAMAVLDLFDGSLGIILAVSIVSLPILFITVSWGSGMIAAIYEIRGKRSRYPLPGRRTTDFVESYLQRRGWMLREHDDGNSL